MTTGKWLQRGRGDIIYMKTKGDEKYAPAQRLTLPQRAPQVYLRTTQRGGPKQGGGGGGHDGSHNPLPVNRASPIDGSLSNRNNIQLKSNAPHELFVTERDHI